VRLLSDDNNVRVSIQATNIVDSSATSIMAIYADYPNPNKNNKIDGNGKNFRLSRDDILYIGIKIKTTTQSSTSGTYVITFTLNVNII